MVHAIALLGLTLYGSVAADSRAASYFDQVTALRSRGESPAGDLERFVREVPRAPRGTNAADAAASLSRYLFETWKLRAERSPGSRARAENALPDRVLAGREGDCVGLSALLLLGAEASGIRAALVRAPDHVFVRVCADDGCVNVEPLEGGASWSDEVYREKLSIPEAAVAAGAYLRSLEDPSELGATLHQRLGYAAERAGDAAGAARHFRNAVRLSPRFGEAYSNLATVTRDAAEAKSLLEKARSLNPWHYAAAVNLSLLDSAPAGGGSPACPILTRLAPEPGELDNGMLLKMDPAWKDPAQVSGLTATDWGSIRPWEIRSCGARYCAFPRSQALVHRIHLRPRSLPGGALNPRWLPPRLFPCGETPHKNFVTYECTIEHEKVHVVQRDDAIAEACPAFLAELGGISAPTETEADRLAALAYRKLTTLAAARDGEEIPYAFEWKCNSGLAAREGVVCRESPEWTALPFLKGVTPREAGAGRLVFERSGRTEFVAELRGDATRLTTSGPSGGCERKEWFFGNGILDQENCVLPGGRVRKTFYEFSRRQREVEVGLTGEKLREEVFFDPRERILKD